MIKIITELVSKNKPAQLLIIVSLFVAAFFTMEFLKTDNKSDQFVLNQLVEKKEELRRCNDEIKYLRDINKKTDLEVTRLLIEDVKNKQEINIIRYEIETFKKMHKK